MDVVVATVTASQQNSLRVGNSSPDNGYKNFVTGRTFPIDDVLGILSQIVDDPLAIESCSYGYFGKIIVQFRSTNGRRRFAKIALHPYSVALLEQEARGLEKFRTEGNQSLGVPTYELTRLTNDTAVALMDALPGATPGRANILKCPPTPFGQNIEWVALPPFIEHLLQTIPDDDQGYVIRQSVARILQQLPIDAIPVSPAHGDFVYWNILKSPNGSFCILDFEDYKSAAVAGYDMFYWHVLPMTRFTLRHSLHALQVALINIAAKTFWKLYGNQISASHAVNQENKHQLARCALAIMLATHAGQMLSEHRLPDITDLIGADALMLRKRLCRQYSLLLEALLR